jgi:dUTP pyrophosphatase
MYIDAVKAHNKSIDENDYFDAGFNLICPVELDVCGGSTAKIDLGVRGAMDFVVENDRILAKDSCEFFGKNVDEGNDFAAVPVGYFLYPRSSTGTKTPLRLANSIGVIDAGYRGTYIAAFDNIRAADFKVECGQRLVQLCPPNLTYPLRVELVADSELNMKTVRGEGGFGSTGK